MIFWCSGCLFGDNLDPITLKAANGVEVEIVAIHKISPDGLTFSPKPDKPLIGSNKLLTVTTGWENIDTDSISSYPALAEAYSAAQEGKTSSLSIGPHFHSLSTSQEKVLSYIPRIKYWVGSNYFVTTLDELVMDHGRLRPKRWAIGNDDYKKTVDLWKEIHDELGKINYRSDVIKYRSILERSLDGIKKINNGETTFDISSARYINELYKGRAR
ncbi:MAG: hypothetical protein ACPGSB_08495 [Opitutales bacterium]